MDTLPDPLDDRVLKDVLPPPQKPLSYSKLYPKKSIRIYNIRWYTRLEGSEGPSRKGRSFRQARLVRTD